MKNASLSILGLLLMSMACGGNGGAINGSGVAGGGGGGGGNGGGGGAGGNVASASVAWLQEVSGSTFVFTPMVGTYANDQTFSSKPISSMQQDMYVSVSLSTDGKKIAYSAGAQIYTADVDGTGQKLIQVDGSGPEWAPDGSKIVFNRVLSGGMTQTWIMSADGSNERLLMDGQYTNGGNFSSDGQTIVAGANNGIATFDVNGGNFKQLTTSVYTDSYGSWYLDLLPAYSKGGHIVFTRFVTPCGQLYCYDPYVDVMMMNADGTNVHSLSQGSSDQIYVEPTPVSNGKILVASNVANAGTSTLDIYALTFASADESGVPTITRLTNNSLFDGFSTYLYGSTGWGVVPLISGLH